VRLPLGQGFAGRIAAERVAIYIADVDHADILNPILRDKGIRSLLGVPMIVQGDLIGVMHVGALKPRQFGEDDVALLELAAARAAPGIDRARLFYELEREHQVAMVLQRSLLPRRLPEIPGVRVSTRYLAARNEVGGDWYDVIELPRGLVGVAIGDVVGHGVKAAALMGQLRTALRSYAIAGQTPGRTLELVDRFVRNTDVSAMATAAYAVFDPESGLLRFATAGHLPPIISAGADSRVVDVTPAVPLGAYPYSRYEDRELVLAQGETFVLYTDGLVERPGVDLDDGIDHLLEVIRDARTPEGACLLALEHLVPTEGPRDDVAILAFESTPVEDRLDLQLSADPNVLSRVRHIVRRWLRSKGADEDALTEITIAVSEACANAIEHAYAPLPALFELTGDVVDGEVVLRVRDGGRWRNPRGINRGRGLIVMETAMDSVEIDRTEGGTDVVLRRRLVSR
jgi:anti-sigma regulatory factor (Ser/Thr protein kinase)